MTAKGKLPPEINYAYVFQLRVARKRPKVFWRCIELRTPQGSRFLVYDSPPLEEELPALMWRLQTCAAECNYEIYVTAAGEATCFVPPIERNTKG